MLKKMFCYATTFVTLFYCGCCNILAYDYVDTGNQDIVEGTIKNIYSQKEQFEDLAGIREDDDDSVDLQNATSDSFWWPIGSNEAIEVDGKKYAKGDPETVMITSPFGYRSDPFGRGSKFHSGVDISGGDGDINIIASKSGVVVYPAAGSPTNCPSGSGMSSCGGGYGNYVIIQHSDTSYTLYAHLLPNTITVTAGESVEQGQVIAKMGSSGYSTGLHLHFEVREGQNSGQSTVDPLTYVDPNNPRIVNIVSNVDASSGDAKVTEFINSWEGSSPISGDYYIVENIGDGVRTVGAGVTLENNVSRFATYGININDYPIGSKIKRSIVDQIKVEIVAERRTYVENILSRNSLKLDEYKVESLMSIAYNKGNINGFTDSYKQYGDTNKLRDSWFLGTIPQNSKFTKGWTRRRKSEWKLFHEGVYDYNV